MRRVGLTGGEILFACVYRDEVSADVDYTQVWSFELGSPSSSARCGGTYLVWGAWFPSHVPLEETGHI
jgi:hypothetical protein